MKVQAKNLHHQNSYKYSFFKLIKMENVWSSHVVSMVLLSPPEMVSYLHWMMLLGESPWKKPNPQ